MKILIESTGRTTECNGVPCGEWRGVTEGGVRCVVLVQALAVCEGPDEAEFERELTSIPAPPEALTPLPDVLWEALG